VIDVDWIFKMNKRRRILILGASSDIGIDTVKIYLNKGWSVTAHYFSNKNKLDKLKKIYGSQLSFFQFNFLKVINLEKYIKKNKSFFNKFDAYISLTGYFNFIKFENFKVKDFYQHINSNYLSNLLIIREVLKGMKKRKWGRILLSSSIGTKFGGGDKTFVYSLSKFMNEFFPRYFQSFYKDNILINTILIGVTDTKMHKGNKKLKKRINMIPIKRIAKPSEVASYNYFLCSEENSLITGQKLNISGGE